MGHFGAPHWVDLLGLLSGSAGVCIAIWLQLVTPRRVRPRYVIGFLVLGSSLMLINLEPIIPENGNAILVARAMSYLTLLVLQTLLAYHVWQEAEVSPVQDTREWLFDENGNGGKH